MFITPIINLTKLTKVANSADEAHKYLRYDARNLTSTLELVEKKAAKGIEFDSDNYFKPTTNFNINKANDEIHEIDFQL